MSTSMQESSITPAASVLLARSSKSQELLVVRRSPSLRFFGGFLAFPGGKTSRNDAEIPIRLLQDIIPPSPALTCRIVAAARELFEETGILLARQADGSFPSVKADLANGRRDLILQNKTF